MWDWTFLKKYSFHQIYNQAVTKYCRKSEKCSLKFEWINNYTALLHWPPFYLKWPIFILYQEIHIMYNGESRFYNKIYSNIHILFHLILSLKHYQGLDLIFTGNCYKISELFYTIYNIRRQTCPWLLSKSNLKEKKKALFSEVIALALAI